ncbi:DoxX family protein [Solirubrobacter taibaiensis]|nr:DoxX family protein [Solirubrobacter taibaiensis]
MTFGIAILRAVVGGLFIGHGTQKLKGWFGGYGIEGTGGWMESIGLYPGKHHATAGGLAETAGGALLIAGLATPAASAAITGSMTVATLKVHGPNGVWGQNNGYELPLVMTVAAFAITASGPGSFSLDRREWGTAWALAALGAGIAGGYAAVKYGEGNAPADAPGATEEAT